MRVDLDAPTGDHIQRMARLYQLMKVDQVLPYFEESDTEEVAQVLMAIDDPRRHGRLLTALLERFPVKGGEVEQLMITNSEGGIMIEVTRLNGEPITLNVMQIETVEAGADTRISLVSREQSLCARTGRY